MSITEPSQFSVGDIVRSRRTPTCVQRVAKVGIDDYSGEQLVWCETIWRFDGTPLSGTKLCAKLGDAYVRLTKEELVDAAERLTEII